MRTERMAWNGCVSAERGIRTGCGIQLDSSIMQRCANWLSLVLLIGLAACAATNGSERARTRSTETMDPAFRLLRLALNDGDLVVARGLLQGIQNRAPSGAALEMAAGFEQLLRGRELAQGITLGLRAEEHRDDAEAIVALDVFLQIQNQHPHPIELSLDLARMRQLKVSMDAGGSETRRSLHHFLPASQPLRLGAGGRLEQNLGLVELDFGDALARRDRLEIEVTACRVQLEDGEVFSVALGEAQLEWVGRAPWLPSSDLDPEVFLEYIQARRISLPAVLERAVRIPPQQWNETLVALAELAPKLNDGRLGYITPAMRWLARSARPGGDPQVWRLELERHRKLHGSIRNPLDLPEDR